MTVKTLADLSGAPYNPRTISEKSLGGLKYSMAEFGDLSGIVFNERTGHLVAGHQRTKGLRQQYGDLQIVDGQITTPEGHVFPVRVVDWPIEKEKAANVAANATTIQGSFTADLSALVAEIEVDMPEAFSALDLDTMIGELDDGDAEPVAAAEEDEPPEVVEDGEPDSVRGEVYELGPHRLMCGDSTDAESWGRLLGGEKIQMVWSDPPYGVAYVGKTKDTLVIENDDLDEDGLRHLLDGSLGAVAAFCVPGASWYIASPAVPLFAVFGAALAALGIWRHTLLWLKDQFVLGRCDYHYRHEAIFYGWVPGGPHYFVKDRTQDSVLEFPRPKRSEDHPTMKPIPLVARCIQNSSKKGWLVADPFLGSGTTLIAAAETGRHCCGIEISPRYCDVIRRRWTRWATKHDVDPGHGALE